MNDGIKCLSKDLLDSILSLQRETGLRLEHTLDKNYIERLDSDTLLPVAWHVRYTDDIIRAGVVLNEDGDIGIIDIPLCLFETLIEVRL
jgi:hypothetical protein